MNIDHFKKDANSLSAKVDLGLEDEQRVVELGAEGKKFSTLVRLIRDRGENQKIRPVGKMFVKESKEIMRKASMYFEARPEQILEKYKRLKRLGLPVVPTMRISEDGSKIMMTDISNEGKKIIVDSHYSSQKK